MSLPDLWENCWHLSSSVVAVGKTPSRNEVQRGKTALYGGLSGTVTKD